MGWGSWMVPEVAPETEFALRLDGVRLGQVVTSQPQEVVDLAVSLAHHNLQLQSIISKATQRIAELEAQQATQTPDWCRAGPRELQPAPRWRSWWRWW